MAAPPATATTPGPLTPPGPEAAQPWSTQLLVGVGLGGVGLIVALAGGLLAANRSSVLGDPASTGDAKASARTQGLVSLSAVAVGILTTGAGGFFTWKSLSSDP